MTHVRLALQFSYATDGFGIDIDDVAIASGESVVLVGPSGSGKSTVLQLMAGLLKPSAGCVELNSADLQSLNDRQRREFRLTNVAYIPQSFELIEHLTVEDNLLLSFRLNNVLRLTQEVRSFAKRVASQLDIADKLRRFPSRLSHGEQQRVAIGRALMTKPQLLLADEPTGSLDPTAKLQIVDLLLTAAKERDATVVMATHDHGLLSRFDRVIDVRDWTTSRREVVEA